MMLPTQSETTTIHRLRVRAPGLDPLAARLRAEFALNTAELRPPGLSPSMVLCVRRLRDPRPGSLDLTQAGQAAGAVWQRSVQEELGRLARLAARPAREPVPAGAEAVLFADQGELLACLARDWLEGSLISHWWWNSLTRDLDAGRLVLRAWLESPAYLPAALEQLAAKGLAVAFVQRLETHAALRLLSAMLEKTGLMDLNGTLSSWAATASRVSEKNLPARPPPWHVSARESSSRELEPVQAALLGIGLSLRRVPHIARSVRFVRALRSWMESKAEASRALPAQPASEEQLVDMALTFTDPSIREPDEQVFLIDSRPSEDHLFSPLQYLKRSSQEDLQQQEQSLDTQFQQLSDNSAARDETQQQIQSVPDDQTSAWPVNDQSGSEEWSTHLDGIWFETGLGGLFYLINLGIYLDLYGDFTTPLEPGLDLPIWDFVALLGRAMLGADRSSPSNDPIWDWLARLSGRRSETPPGADFFPADSWRIPPNWLAVFPSDEHWQWSDDDRRLRIAHPAGFIVLDVPLTSGKVIDRLTDELHAYEGHFKTALAAGSLEPHPAMDWGANLSLARWLGWLLPYIRARLCLALGLQDPDDMPDLLCAHSARVYLTDTHLDVTFPLNNLPVEVRLAGLDRNPGWVPAANRYVMFYYDE